MNRLSAGAVAVLALLLILVASAPARLVKGFLPADQVMLHGVSGTLWQGQCSRALVAVEGGYLHLGRLSWSLSPASLLTLAPRVTLDTRWGAQRIQGEIVYRSSDSIKLSDVDAVLPATLVRQFVPLELSGHFALQLSRLVIDDGLPLEADGRLVWQDGGWLSPQGERSLGSYAIDIVQAEGSAMLGEVVTLSGDLEADGTVSLDGREYSVDIELSGRGLQDPELQQALQLVAIPEGDRFRVKMQGSF